MSLNFSFLFLVAIAEAFKIEWAGVVLSNLKIEKKRNVLRVQKYVVQLPVQLHCVDVIKNELRQQKMRR